MTGIVALLLSLVGGSAACEPVSSGDLSAALGAAEAALAEGDRADFSAGLQRVRDELLPCLQGPIRFDVAAAYHQSLGYAAAAESPSAAEPYFRAARGLNAPAPPEALASPASPLAEAWARALPGPALSPLAPPARGQLVIDGQLSREVPTDRPYLFQHVRPNNRPWQTAYVEPGAAPPAYTTRGRAMLYASGGVLALAGVELLGAAAFKGRIYSGEVPSGQGAQLERWARWNRGLIVGSGVTAGLALGTFGASFAMGW